jgi:type IV secretion system protein VirB6
MASDFHFYSHTFSDLNTALSTYVGDTAANIISQFSSVAYTMLTIYVILWGWTMLRGMISEPVTDGMARIIRLTIIVSIAINIGIYNTALGNFLWQTPDALASAVVGSGYDGTSTVQFLDQLMSQMYDLGDAYWQKANASSGMLPIPDMGLLAIAIAVWCIGVAATAYAAFLLALSKCMLAIILGVGPIFVLGLMFEGTKRFFEAWMGQALNFVFVVLLAAAGVNLILTILQHYLTDATTAGVLADPSVSQALPAIAISIIGFLVLMQVPSVASGLAGGVAVSTLGAVGWAYGKATGTMAAMRPTALRRSYLRAKSDARIAGNAARAAITAPYTVPRAVYRKITGGTRNRVSQA